MLTIIDENASMFPLCRVMLTPTKGAKIRPLPSQFFASSKGVRCRTNGAG